MLESTVSYIRDFAHAYATLAADFAYFYVSIYDNYLADIDVAMYVREGLFINLSLLSDLFTDVDFVELATTFYETYVLYPYTCMHNAARYLLNSYYSCFETDFIIALDKKMRVYMCELYNKPNFVDKSAWHIMFMDDVAAPKKAGSNSLIAELYWIVGLIGGATMYFIVLGYFTLILIYGAFVLLALIMRSLFGYHTVDDENDESAANYVESEKELGSFDDFIFVVIGLIFVYSLYMGIFLVYTHSAYSFLFAISSLGFPLIMSVAISLPVCFIYDCGLGFVAYLRGSGTTTIFALEFLYDTLAAAITFIRLSIQNVRFLLIFYAYLEVFEFINIECHINERGLAFFQVLYSNIQTCDSMTTLLYTVFIDLPRIVIHGIYLISHLLYTFVSNFVCFVVLMFWFFSFLYTMFYDEKMEFYLKKKRASYAKLMANF